MLSKAMLSKVVATQPRRALKIDGSVGRSAGWRRPRQTPKITPNHARFGQPLVAAAARCAGNVGGISDGENVITTRGTAQALART